MDHTEETSPVGPAPRSGIVHRAVRRLSIGVGATAVIAGSLMISPQAASAATSAGGVWYGPATVQCNSTNLMIAANASRPSGSLVVWQAWARNVSTGQWTNVGQSVLASGSQILATSDGLIFYIPAAGDFMTSLLNTPAQGTASVNWVPSRHGYYQIYTQYYFRNSNGTFEGPYGVWTQNYSTGYQYSTTSCYV